MELLPWSRRSITAKEPVGAFDLNDGMKFNVY
jgi:hypothetical protein